MTVIRSRVIENAELIALHWQLAVIGFFAVLAIGFMV